MEPHFCSPKNPVIKTWLKKSNIAISHFFDASAFFCDFGAPRVLVTADDMKLLLVLPYHIENQKLDLTIFDFWTGRVYKLPTVFPLYRCQIDEGIYYSKFLYVHGIDDEWYFVCRFSFECLEWSLLIREDKTHPIRFFVPQKNGVKGIYNFMDGRLTILNVNEKNEVQIVQTQTVNRPPAFVTHHKSLFDGDKHVWKIGFTDGLINKVVSLNLISLTWDSFDVNPHPEFTPLRCGFWSGLIKNHFITYLQPTRNGTKLWQLNLNDLTQGWVPKEHWSEIVVWSTFSNRFDELYGLCIKDDGRNSYLLASQQWLLAVPQLQTFCLSTIFNSLNSTTPSERERVNKSQVVKKSNKSIVNKKFKCDINLQSQLDISQLCLTLPEYFKQILSTRLEITNKLLLTDDDDDDDDDDEEEEEEEEEEDDRQS